MIFQMDWMWAVNERGIKMTRSIVWGSCCHCCCLPASVMSDSVWPYGQQSTRLLCSWDSLGKSTRVGCHALLQGIFPTQESNLGLLDCREILYYWATREARLGSCACQSLSRVWVFGIPQTVAHQASLSMGFSRQEYWSGLPSPEELPNPGIKGWSPASQAGSLLFELQGSPVWAASAQ